VSSIEKAQAGLGSPLADSQSRGVASALPGKGDLSENGTPLGTRNNSISNGANNVNLTTTNLERITNPDGTIRLRETSPEGVTTEQVIDQRGSNFNETKNSTMTEVNIRPPDVLSQNVRPKRDGDAVSSADRAGNQNSSAILTDASPSGSMEPATGSIANQAEKVNAAIARLNTTDAWRWRYYVYQKDTIFAIL
jgi:hypothetical protein